MLRHGLRNTFCVPMIAFCFYLCFKYHPYSFWHQGSKSVLSPALLSVCHFWQMFGFSGKVEIKSKRHLSLIAMRCAPSTSSISRKWRVALHLPLIFSGRRGVLQSGHVAFHGASGVAPQKSPDTLHSLQGYAKKKPVTELLIMFQWKIRVFIQRD